MSPTDGRVVPVRPARHSGRWTRVLVLAAALGTVTACTPHPVGSARTLKGYDAKANTSAASAASAVATVRLAATTARRGHGFGPYLSELISEQEEVLTKVAGTFSSIQPPPGKAEEDGRQLRTILDDAQDHVTAVRIAVRRGQLDDLADVAKPLAADGRALDRFQAEHQ